MNLKSSFSFFIGCSGYSWRLVVGFVIDFFYPIRQKTVNHFFVELLGIITLTGTSFYNVMTLISQKFHNHNLHEN